ncbi:MAG: PAS domain-containing protein [Aliarcobacter sp.]|nr:PAS domain-containing protein [Aliarcobacter sp.]
MKDELILSKDIMIVSETNAKGEIVFANNDFCKIAGYSIDELVGKPHNMVRHKDMPKVAFKSLWETVQAGRIWKGIVKNRTKDGKYYWVNATAFPSKTLNGEIRYISIRVKPTNEEIVNAQKLYSTLE